MGFDKQWSNEDLSILKNGYKSLEFEELCNRLNRTTHSVRWKATQLRLTIPKVDYTPAEDSFILKSHKKKTFKEIADELGRTESSVKKRFYYVAPRQLATYNKKITSIEGNESIPAPKSESYAFMMFNMHVGQSFVYPEKDRQHINNARPRMMQKKYITKKINEVERRIWRIA